MDRSSTLTAKLIGSSSAGVVEIATFHPIDTVIKRMMNNKSAANSLASLRSVIGSVSTLYSGVGFGMLYKVNQRVYKYGGQAQLAEMMPHRGGLAHALSGAAIGVGEVALLPLDIFKIRKQLHPEKYKSKTIVDMVREEGTTLYRGASVTALRNGCGSAALFGANFVAQDSIKSLELNSTLTKALGSASGSIMSLLVSSPMDVVKVRMQAEADGKARAVQVARDILANEGPGAFWKGIVPKILTIGPKLTFSFTIAQVIIEQVTIWTKKD